ncbi:hypothetical protein V501_06250 [Pseudogymnoascus sp. VKM F-4519 (FW-2642)]|nr:hypothetical protein V501_06250 [Pseudogymnoascus sp. VKM F-4519 (FW-2642)]
MTAFWLADDYGVQANWACWTLFAFTYGLLTPSLSFVEQRHSIDANQVPSQSLSGSELSAARTSFVVFEILEQDPTCENSPTYLALTVLNGNLTKPNPTDPVPYLDILGVAEGSILLICASIPTLGPLFHFARGTLTSGGGSRSMPNQSGDNSQGRSGGISNGSWGKVKGDNLEYAERGSIGMTSSVDDIPLVPSSKR